MNALALPGRIAFVGGYEPRQCGIATFTSDLCRAVASAAPGVQCIAGAVNDRLEGYRYPPEVRFEILEKELNSYRRAADFVNFNKTDVVSLQHEFGIYGGAAGSHVLALLKELRAPVVTTLHTVLSVPDPAQRMVMDKLVECSDRLVVMARKGAEILSEVYGVETGKVDIIPHGIPDLPFVDSGNFKPQFGLDGRKVLLTFGLLGPGKGIEHAIEAMPEIVRRHPDAVYVVLGATHPHLVAREGESYRLGLQRLAEDRGVADHVIFHDRFLAPDELQEFIRASDIYLTPYPNEAQITSGTLAYVFGAGKAVVSTPYWHAREMLADDRGTLVPFRDPAAIAEAVCNYLDDPERRARTGEAAYQYSRGMIWPVVARRYLESFHHAVADRTVAAGPGPGIASSGRRPYHLPPLKLDHISHMSDGTGIFQHASFNVPNFHEGYCTDDNARAFILCNLREDHGNSAQLATCYLAFLAAAWNTETGRFRNFMSHGRAWLEESGSEDSHGRALWALGVGAGRSRNAGHRRLSAQFFEWGIPATRHFTSPRAWAFTLLGIHEFLRGGYGDHPGILEARVGLTNKLVKLWQNHATADWPWFEVGATYENARLSQALIMSGRWMPHNDAWKIGLESLRWLTSIQTTSSGNFRPIGSNGFHIRGGVSARFDQQPVEAQAMVSACLEAFLNTRDTYWTTEARRAFEWFLGRNDLGLSLYDPTTGGCGDGLHHDRVSANQGAESSLAFHIALAEMSNAEQLIIPPPHVLP